MEQYFSAARILVGEQEMITTMYLSSDAKLWWRTRASDDVAVGQLKIEILEVLKKVVNDKFLSTNTTLMLESF